MPLHDVWAFSLTGGGEGRTVRDVSTLLEGGLSQTNPLVRGLFRLRGALGRIFGWDKAPHDVPESSYVQRLTEADRAQSLETPGSQQGLFRVVYTLQREALGEIRNGTVQAFSALAMTPTSEGYRVFWAIYVQRVSWLTPWYMALIDPFRRVLVYPTLIKRTQRAWREAYPVG